MSQEELARTLATIRSKLAGGPTDNDLHRADRAGITIYSCRTGKRVPIGFIPPQAR
jgi:hypothetical protein